MELYIFFNASIIYSSIFSIKKVFYIYLKNYLITVKGTRKIKKNTIYEKIYVQDISFDKKCFK